MAMDPDQPHHAHVPFYWQGLAPDLNSHPLPTSFRPSMKRGRSISPERASKRPTLLRLQNTSLSQSHTPLSPTSPVPLQRFEVDESLHHTRRGSSGDLVLRAGRLGLVTPVEGGTPVSLDVGWDEGEGMEMDVDLCADIVSPTVSTRPVLPLRRSAIRSSCPSSLLLSPATPFSIITTASAFSRPHSASNHPLHRPHPFAYQQHLALSSGGGQRPPSMHAQDAVMRLSSPNPPASPKQNGGGGVKFTMGPREGCEKCQLKMPGHYGHVIEDSS